MVSSIDRMRHAQIWDLLDQYADIRDRLEDLLYSMQMLQSQLTSDLDDLSDDFDDLTEELSKCSKNLIRFKTVPVSPLTDDQAGSAVSEQLPFPNKDAPYRMRSHAWPWKNVRPLSLLLMKPTTSATLS